MKHYFWILLFSHLAFADPFYGEFSSTTQAVEKSEKFAKKSTNFTACELPNNLNDLNLSTEFEDLKLVGLVKIEQQFRALFIDKENNLYEFKENDFLKEKLIQFSSINLRQVQYIHWELTENCHHPFIITKKL